MTDLDRVDRFLEITEESPVARYIYDYIVQGFGNGDPERIRVYIEENYTDKEYLADYQRFYSRSSSDFPRRTTRVHFFREDISMDKLISYDVDDEEIDDVYLGFTVIKPIRDAYDSPLIGRTVLRCYPERFYVKIRENISLLGRDLHVDTTPFICQDIAVGACATAAVWSVMSVLSSTLRIEMPSMATITEEANKIPPTVFSNKQPSSPRTFPSPGLDSPQMCFYLKSRGFEVDVAYFDANQNLETKRNAALTFIVGILECGVPIIACLNLYRNGSEQPSDLHAVAITGYKLDGNEIERLYVHDDQVGPFVSVKSQDSFFTWEYSKDAGWTEQGYTKITLDHIIIPMYHKIRLPFREVFSFQKLIESSNAKVRMRLMPSSRYKAELRRKKIADPEILFRQMPRYIWVAESEDHSADAITDATSPMLRDMILFDHERGILMEKKLSKSARTTRIK